MHLCQLYVSQCKLDTAYDIIHVHRVAITGESYFVLLNLCTSFDQEAGSYGNEYGIRRS